MNDELISIFRKWADIANPARLTAGRWLSLPVCTDLFIAVSLIPSCLSLSVNLAVAIIIVICTAQYIYQFSKKMCRKALVPHSHISSLEPLHSPLPLIKSQMAQAITLKRVT